MPTNLPPEYLEAEKKFKLAKTPQEKVSALENLISTVPKHKGTDKLRADLRRKLSKLRNEAFKKKKSGRGALYTIEKEGAAQIALVGFPNSGKSSILKNFTNAHPTIADYPMSTVMPLSGMMVFEDIQFQLVDLPPIGNESTDGWVSGILRNADMLMLVINLSEAGDIETELLIEELKNWKIYLKTKREDKKEENKNFPLKPFVIAANKSDLPSGEKSLKNLVQKYHHLCPIIPISTLKKEGFQDLKKTLFAISKIIRVYTKECGKEPDTHKPFTLTYGSTILELAEIVHKDFVHKLKYACIWGSSKFPGQRVHKGYILQDKDIVELHL